MKTTEGYRPTTPRPQCCMLFRSFPKRSFNRYYLPRRLSIFITQVLCNGSTVCCGIAMLWYLISIPMAILNFKFTVSCTLCVEHRSLGVRKPDVTIWANSYCYPRRVPSHQNLYNLYFKFNVTSIPARDG